jgi:hypothetical protein
MCVAHLSETDLAVLFWFVAFDVQASVPGPRAAGDANAVSNNAAATPAKMNLNLDIFMKLTWTVAVFSRSV